MAIESFHHVEQEYLRLKGMLSLGRLTRAQFDAALEQLTVRDAQGRYWALHPDSGKWLVHDGATWIEAQPYPGAAPISGAPVPSPRTGVWIAIALGIGVLCIILAALAGILVNQGTVQISLLSSPTPTVTLTLVPTATVTASPVPTQLPSPIPSPTLPPPPTFAPIPTAISVILPTLTATPTPPPTVTRTASPSQTAQPSPTATSSATPSRTPTPSPTSTATPTPPPSGKIAYSQCDQQCLTAESSTVWIVNADGSGAWKVLDRGSQPAFSPDGRMIAYTHYPEDVWIVNGDGTNPRVLVRSFWSYDPVWSHNGKWIAYSESVGSGANEFVSVIAPDGSSRRAITPGKDPTWSSDDSQLAFTTCVGSTCGIYKVNVSGGDPVLVVGDDAGLADWSPDGKRILYHMNIDGQRQIFTINSDGSGKQQLTSGGLHTQGTWSPDGRFIFYQSTEGGGWGIWVMNADGTNPHKIISTLQPAGGSRERLSVTK